MLKHAVLGIKDLRRLVELCCLRSELRVRNPQALKNPSPDLCSLSFKLHWNLVYMINAEVFLFKF